MTNNLTSNNLSPFVSDKTLKKKYFKFKDFISNETNPLPLIPGIYFNNNEKDNIGSKIINNYYNIKIFMKNLLLIKTFILSILKVSGSNDLDKINISKEKYKLLKSDLIIPFNDTLSGTFKDQDYFKKFIKLYQDQKYGIFKNFNLEIPYFFQIFQVEYNNSPKTFFISLFKKYIDLRKKILSYIGENSGLLAFTSFFDLSDNIDFGMLKNNIRSKNGNNNDEYNENYKNYILYGNNINILSNEGKENKKKITDKIHSFDYLYVSKFDNSYYKKKHQEQIHKNYFNLNESINNFIGSDAKFDLLSVIKNNLEVDYNTIHFIFNYVDPLLYGKAVDSNILVKQFISKKINNFELYYDQYMYWIKAFCENIEGKKSNIDNDYNFSKFYDKILNNIDKDYKSPCDYPVVSPNIKNIKVNGSSIIETPSEIGSSGTVPPNIKNNNTKKENEDLQLKINSAKLLNSGKLGNNENNNTKKENEDLQLKINANENNKIIKNIEDNLENIISKKKVLNDNQLKTIIKEKINKSKLSSINQKEKNEIIQNISSRFFKIDDKTSNNKKYPILNSIN